MRVAIYARTSTDRQNVDSPADQIARCREFAKARGWRVAEDLVVEEPAVSGASRHNRPAFVKLFARIDEWDVLLAYDFARLSRDGEDLGWIRNELRARRRSAFEAKTGLDIFNIGSRVLGVFSEEFREQVARDTHRGLQGRVERGLSAGGRPFGYDSIREPDGKGSRLHVNPEQAEVVCRIFSAYVAGESLRALAYRLNAENVPAPRPRRAKRLAPAWSLTAVREMLRNPIYRGELVWNKSVWTKVHATGKRVRHERPESEWLRRVDEC